MTQQYIHIYRMPCYDSSKPLPSQLFPSNMGPSTTDAIVPSYWYGVQSTSTTSELEHLAGIQNPGKWIPSALSSMVPEFKQLIFTGVAWLFGLGVIEKRDQVDLVIFKARVLTSS